MAVGLGHTRFGTVIGEGTAAGGDGELDLRRASVPMEGMLVDVKSMVEKRDSGREVGDSHRQLQATMRESDVCRAPQSQPHYKNSRAIGLHIKVVQSSSS